MGLMMVAGAEQSGVLTLLLLAAIGLTFWECRDQGLDRKVTAWWVLAVALVHIPAYLILLGWGRSRRTAEAR